MDGQGADIAAGKEEGTYDIGIGAEGEAGPIDGEDGAIVEGREQGVAETGQDDALDKLLAELSAAAVGEDDFLVIADGQRAGAEERGGVAAVFAV